MSEYEIGRIISHYTGIYEDNQTDEIIDNFHNSYQIVLYEKYDVDITFIIDKQTSLIYGMDVRVFNDNKLY